MTVKFEKLPDYGDHMTMDEFVKACLCGAFIDYDGHGCYATANMMSNLVVSPSDVMQGKHDTSYTHVVWFNK